MDLLGVGPLELLFFVVLLLALFGPKDLGQGARQLGMWINRLTRTEAFRTVQALRDEIANLPQQLANEAHLADIQRELHNQTIAPPTAPPAETPPPPTSPPPSPANPYAAWVKPSDPPPPSQP